MQGAVLRPMGSARMVFRGKGGQLLAGFFHVALMGDDVAALDRNQSLQAGHRVLQQRGLAENL